MVHEVQSLAEWESEGVAGLLSVLIPAHNEEGHIAATVRSLHGTLEREQITHEIVVVNDNSSDKTESILRALASEIPGVRWLNNEPPNGFGFAVRCGLAKFRGEAVAIVMADGADDPEDVVKFWRKLQEGYDCAFGTRWSRGGNSIDYPWPKRVLNRLGNLFIMALFLSRYNDVTNAFKMYRRSVIAAVQPLLAYHFNLTVELPLKAMARGCSYAVVPNSWRNRKAGASKFHIKEMGSRYLFIILYCWLEKVLSHRDYVQRAAMRQTQLQVWPR